LASGEGRDQLAEPFAELLAEASEGGNHPAHCPGQGREVASVLAINETDISAHVLTPGCMVALRPLHTILSTQAPLAVE